MVTYQLTHVVLGPRVLALSAVLPLLVAMTLTLARRREQTKQNKEEIDFKYEKGQDQV